MDDRTELYGVGSLALIFVQKIAQRIVEKDIICKREREREGVSEGGLKLVFKFVKEEGKLKAYVYERLDV